MRKLESEIDDLDEDVAVEEAFAPIGLEIGEGLCGDGFLGGFAGGLQLLDAVAGGDEHLAEFGEVRFIAERTVAADDLSVIIGERQNLVGSGDHAADFAAGAPVDVRIDAIEKSVTHLDDVGFLKMNEDVRVRVRGGKVFEHEGFAVGFELASGGESLLGQSLGRGRREMQAPDLQVMRLGHALLGVFMRKNSSTGSVQRSVVVGVVKMPVRVNDEFQGRIADAVERFLELGPSRRNESVHDNFAVGAVQLVASTIKDKLETGK